MFDYIDQLSQLPDGYTFEDIHCLYGTGRALGHRGRSGYRSGIMTPIGDVERSVWLEAAEALIKRTGEGKLLDALIKWSRDNCAWLRKEREYREYAIELHVNRIFDNPKWIGQSDFYNHYYKKETDNHEKTLEKNGKGQDGESRRHKDQPQNEPRALARSYLRLPDQRRDRPSYATRLLGALGLSRRLPQRPSVPLQQLPPHSGTANQEAVEEGEKK